MEKLKEIWLTFLFGGICYGIIEIVARGYTHWSMLVTGGICFALFYELHFRLRTQNIWMRCMLATSIITSFEFIVGCLVNLIFHLKVWDYSHLPFNILGQICLLYSVIWFFFGFPMTYAANRIKMYVQRKQEKQGEISSYLKEKIR